MSLYIIEDDDCNVLTNECYFDNTMIYARLYDEPSEPEHDAKKYGGHVVTLIEDPEKIVISKEQAQLVKEAHEYRWPAKYITDHCGNSNGLEELLMKAYVNGYTVVKDKKYNLVLGTDTGGDTNALVKYNPCTDDELWLNTDTYTDDLKLGKLYQFTQEEIDKYNNDFWIKGIDLNDYKIEVTDDEV